MTARPGSQSQDQWAAFEWWQTRLASAFFGKNRGGSPVLFFIDQKELRTLQGQNGAAELGLTVSSVLAWHDNPYRPVTERCRAWRRGKREDPPPCLPLLAAAVLAAANMAKTAAGPGATAYYARLAEVLQPRWSRGTGHHRKPLQDYYSAVVEQWEWLDAWLREHGGKHGISTIRKHPTYTRIGYAQSQALVRASDHAALHRFFQAAGLPPGEPADGARLLRDLKMWSRKSPQGLSQGLRWALDSDSDRPLLEPLLAALLEDWNGTLTQSRISGLLRVPLRVLLEADYTGWEARWHAKAVPGVDSDSLNHSGGILHLTPETGDETYALSGAIPALPDALQLGFTARGAKTSVRVESGRNILALREDPVAGGWTETDALTVFEPYVFLFTPVGQSPLRKFLTDAGQRWYQPEAIPLRGWQATPELRFDDEEALSAALAVSRIQDIRHTPGHQVSLRNGLRVKPEWGHRTVFLRGGEPDVMVPQALRAPGLITLNGEPLAVSPDGLTPLRGKDLAAGKYSLSAGSTCLTFWLEPGLETRAYAPAGPALATPADTVVVPLDGDARFLTAQGSYLHVRRPQEPSWWTERAPLLCGSATARVPVPPEAVWLVTIPGSGATSISLLRPEEPDIKTLSRDAKDFWSQLILISLPGVPHSSLWKRYRQAALSQFPQKGFRHV
ncbi:hypothetical protein ACFYS7_35130 [Streptomyces avermitilis]|uniref:hypothetical protein n=1 Tax=Streptomyces avermitilis TaxID=33903 RepID=UPI003676EC90